MLLAYGVMLNGLLAEHHHPIKRYIGSAHTFAPVFWQAYMHVCIALTVTVSVLVLAG